MNSGFLSGWKDFSHNMHSFTQKENEETEEEHKVNIMSEKGHF